MLVKKIFSIFVLISCLFSVVGCNPVYQSQGDSFSSETVTMSLTPGIPSETTGSAHSETTVSAPSETTGSVPSETTGKSPSETTPESPAATPMSVIRSELLVLEIYDNGYDRSTLGEHIYFFDEIADEMGEWVLVWKANTTLKGFKFLEMDESEELKVEKTLYSLSELTPYKPLVVATYINDATVNRGISFTDSNGDTVYYVIALSMKDGSYTLSKVEFDS